MLNFHFKPEFIQNGAIPNPIPQAPQPEIQETPSATENQLKHEKNHLEAESATAAESTLLPM